MIKFLLNDIEVDSPINYISTRLRKVKSIDYGGYVGVSELLSEDFNELTFTDSVAYDIISSGIDGACDGEIVTAKVLFCNEVVFDGIVKWEATRIIKDNVRAGCNVIIGFESTEVDSGFMNWHNTQVTVPLNRKTERIYKPNIEKGTHDIDGTIFYKGTKHYIPYKAIQEPKIETPNTVILGVDKQPFFEAKADIKVVLNGKVKFKTKTAEGLNNRFGLVFCVNEEKNELVRFESGKEYDYYFKLNLSLKAGDLMYLLVDKFDNSNIVEFEYIGSSFLAVELDNGFITAKVNEISLYDLGVALMNHGDYLIEMPDSLKDVFVTTGAGLLGAADEIRMSFLEYFSEIRTLTGYVFDFSDGVGIIRDVDDGIVSDSYTIDGVNYSETYFVKGSRPRMITAGYKEWQSGGIYGLNEEMSKVDYTSNGTGNVVELFSDWVASKTKIAEVITKKEANGMIYITNGAPTPSEIVQRFVDASGGEYKLSGGVGNWRSAKESISNNGYYGCIGKYIRISGNMSIFNEINREVLIDGVYYEVESVELLPKNRGENEEIEINLRWINV